MMQANFPSRIAFAMASQIDSRTILDTPGAEDLIGRGDMLYQPADLPRPVRLQGVFVSDKEIGAVTDHWRSEIEAAKAFGGPVSYYDMSIVQNDEDSTGSVEACDEGGGGSDDRSIQRDSAAPVRPAGEQQPSGSRDVRAEDLCRRVGESVVDNDHLDPYRV